MEKYSREKFDGFTHRFIIKFRIDHDWRNDVNLTLYSNSDSYEKLRAIVNKRKTDKVVSFEIVQRSTREQDEAAEEMIREMIDRGEI